MSGGLNEGSTQALRSAIEPSYLGTGDPGMTGGGTVRSNDTEAMMQAYENVFGPAARDIKFDTQRQKRHQRWHLPDALKGSSPFLTDRVDGLITDATSSPFTKTILPYMYMENPDRKIKWNVYSFDEGIASRVPYESAARVLPQSKRSFAGYAVRQGLAIAMEHNFMMSAAGMDNFRKQLMQLVGSIQMTNDLDVHMALLHAPSYQRHMDEKYFDQTRTTAQNCRMYVDLFGFMQKNDNALDYLIEDAKNHLETWGSKPPTFMLCNGSLTKQLTMLPEKTNYITAGPDGKRKLAQGPDLPSYRGLSFVNSRKFSTEAGAAPRDMMRRRVRVAEHYRIPWEKENLTKRYEFYDQSRDTMFYLRWSDLATASQPDWTANGVLDYWSRNTTKPPDLPVAEYPANALNAAPAFDGPHTFLDRNDRLVGAWLGLFPYSDSDPSFQDERGTPRQIEILFSDGENRDPRASFKFSTRLRMFNPDGTPNADGVAAQIFMLNVVKLIAAHKRGILFTSIGPVGPGGGGAVQRVDRRCTTSRDLYDELDHLCGGVNPAQVTSIPSGLVGGASAEGTSVIFPADLFILRPNIEHYMLGIIFGRGGGPEELGATFWGQTELSCYDDAQHGIWGMSYKYHERAIVTNERNLIRVFDVCFDGYSGGNDSTILRWNEDDTRKFREQTSTLNGPYAGPSMLVMALPRKQDAFAAFPNPVVWAADYFNEPLDAGRDRGLRAGQDKQMHMPFLHPDTNTSNKWCDHDVHYAYKRYYDALQVNNWLAMTQNQPPGVMSVNNETDVNHFSFHGHLGVISRDGKAEYTQGSGHLGPSFVGVASVREGRGLMGGVPRSMPALQHLV